MPPTNRDPHTTPVPGDLLRNPETEALLFVVNVGDGVEYVKAFQASETLLYVVLASWRELSKEWEVVRAND